MESLRRVRTVFTVLCFIGAALFLAVAYTSALGHIRLAFLALAVSAFMAAYAARSRTVGEGLTTAWFLVFSPALAAKVVSENPERLGEGLVLVAAITVGVWVAARVAWWIAAPLVRRTLSR